METMYFKPEVQAERVDGHIAAGFVGVGKPGSVWSPMPCIIRPTRPMQVFISKLLSIKTQVQNDGRCLLELATITPTTISMLRPSKKELWPKTGPVVVTGHEAHAYVTHANKPGLLDNNDSLATEAEVEHSYKMPSRARCRVWLNKAEENNFYMACVGVVLSDSADLAIPAAFDMNDKELGNVFNLDKGRRALHIGVVQIHSPDTPCAWNEKEPRLHHHYAYASDSCNDGDGEGAPLEELLEQLARGRSKIIRL